MSKIEIRDFHSLRDGDRVTAKLNDTVITGLVVGIGFGTPRIELPSGFFGVTSETFVSAERELELPTERLAVITDVVDVNGGRYSAGIYDFKGDGHWSCFADDGYVEQLEAWEIKFFKEVTK